MSDTTGDVVIRPGATADVAEVAALWCEAFPGKRTAEERARMLVAGGRYGGLETVLVARDVADRLLGACKIYRMTQHITGVPMPMMGLAAVAVAPSARRRGLGARVCVTALKAARDRGDVVSTLYPFRADYYERLGWGLVGELHEYRFHTAALPACDEARHVRAARGDADAAAIAACYDRIASRSNGPIRRSARVWADRLPAEALGTRPVIVHDRDGVTGYALLHRPRGGGAGRAGRAGGAVQVRELVAETEAAYRGLLGYLAGQADRWPVARHTARLEEGFGDRLSNPRAVGAGRARSLYFPTARVIRGPMLRVVDARRALGMRRYFDATLARAPSAATIEVTIEDAQVPENRGPWRLEIRGQDARVAPAAGEPAEARLRAGAPVFARIFAGDVAPGLAARSGRAEVDGNTDLLDRAFATRERCWLLDEF